MTSSDPLLAKVLNVESAVASGLFDVQAAAISFEN